MPRIARPLGTMESSSNSGPFFFSFYDSNSMIPFINLFLVLKVAWLLGVNDSSSSSGLNQTQPQALKSIFFPSNLSSMAPSTKLFSASKIAFPLGEPLGENDLSSNSCPFFSYKLSSMAPSTELLSAPKVVRPLGVKLKLESFFCSSFYDSNSMAPFVKLLSTPIVVWPLGVKDPSSSSGPN
jgi:hypothetical protein